MGIKHRVVRAVMAASVVAGSLVGAAAPAQATHCDGPNYLDPKEPSRPDPYEYGFITVDGLDVNVNPANGPAYLVAAAGWYASIVGVTYCEVGAGPIVDCLTTKAGEIVGSLQPTQLNLRYVYQDANGGFQIAGNVLVADASYILNSCLLRFSE